MNVNERFDLARHIDAIRRFRDARQWGRFHTPRNLATALAVEAAELIEIFQWSESNGWDEVGSPGSVNDAVRDEVADILIYLMQFADVTGLDLDQAVADKLEKNAIKYPPRV